MLIGLVAALHLFFLVLEMFLRTSPLGRRVFANTRERAASTRVVAADQGLYNGFLAAGLVWGLASGQEDVQVFFLACVIVAGAYGAVSVSPKIFVVQAVPALLASGAVLAAG